MKARRQKHRVRSSTLRDRSSKAATKQSEHSGSGEEEADPPGTVKVGDFVQWTSNGTDQFKPPRKVTKIDGEYAFVHGSLTGIKMTELTTVDPPKPVATGASSSYQADNDQTQADISVLQVGKRLEITANVDADGLKKLKELLDHYEKILTLLQ